MNSILQQRPQPLVSLSSDFEVISCWWVTVVKTDHQPDRPHPAARLASAALGTFLARSPKGLAASGRPRGICGSRRGGEGRGVEILGVKACLWLPPAPAPLPSTPRKRTGVPFNKPQVTGRRHHPHDETTHDEAAPGLGAVAMRPAPTWRGSPRGLSHLQVPSGATTRSAHAPGQAGQLAPSSLRPLPRPPASQGLAVFTPLLPPPTPTQGPHIPDPSRFLKSKRGGSLSGAGDRKGGAQEEAPGGPGVLAREKTPREGRRGGRGGVGGAAHGAGPQAAAATWRGRPRCPPSVLPPPPQSSGHPCSVSALFPPHALSPPSAPR